MKALGTVVAIVLVLILGGCSKNTVSQYVTNDYQFGVERGFAPDVPTIVEEGEFSEVPLYETVAEALEGQQKNILSTQGETGPKTAKRRTHTFSNGETVTYMVYEGIIFDGDVVLGTYKQLFDAIKDYEKEIAKRGKFYGEITPQGAFYQNYCANRAFFILWCIDYARDIWPSSTLYIDRDTITRNFTTAQQNDIFRALNYIDASTDVIVVYRTSGARVGFTKAGSGCFATPGYTPREQPQTINLSDNCFSSDNRAVVHEIGHALGLMHEHQRNDRNSYISINTSNLTQKGLDNLSVTYPPSSQTAYDYASIMHYTRFTGDITFVLNTSQPMFNVTTSYTGTVGGSSLTATDIAAINARY
jgi:Astacin (Peptidase family M12A)